MTHPAIEATVDEPKENRTREKLRQQFREGRLDDRTVEIDARDRSAANIEIVGMQGNEEMDVNLKDILPGLFGPRSRKKKMKVSEAFDYLIQEEESRLIDMDIVTRVAIERVEDSGIVFLDEIDKIAGREGGHGPDVSREGVQRDILPIVEGTTVNTKYGFVSNGSHPLHRRRCLSRLQAERSDSRAAGAFSDPRGAAAADRRRLYPHPDRAEVLAGQAVDRSAGTPRA